MRGGLGVLQELGENAGVHGEALLLGGETRATDVVPVAGYGVGGGAADRSVSSSVPGRVVGAGGEDVVDHLDLAVAVDTGADADGRDGDSLGDELGQGAGTHSRTMENAPASSRALASLRSWAAFSGVLP